jgi:hypothetical protein
LAGPKGSEKRREIMEDFTTSKSREGIQSTAGDSAKVDVEMSKVGITVIGFMAALIGIWGLACFVGGLMNSGGPLSFVKNWFGAVLGI